jgi:hypothetical protein
MGRGLDGYFYLHWPCAVFKLHRGRLAKFRWRIASGRHLFPFRTEQLSHSAPMVLGGQPPGRVGRRRFFIQHSSPTAMVGLDLFRANTPRFQGLLEKAVGPLEHDLSDRTAPPSRLRAGWPAPAQTARAATSRPRALPRCRVPCRAGARWRDSQVASGRSAGSMPYSPSVAKSISRSTASVSRPVSDVFESNMGSQFRDGVGRASDSARLLALRAWRHAPWVLSRG